jgi:chromosome condensin MukBEF ATPase and DNA-binding subunit MukB
MELDAEEKEKKKKLTDDKQTLTDLQAITSPTVREQSKIRRLLVTIPKLETRLKELPPLIKDEALKFSNLETEEKVIETEIKAIEKEIKTIPITDIRLLEKALVNQKN